MPVVGGRAVLESSFGGHQTGAPKAEGTNYPNTPTPAGSSSQAWLANL